MSRSPDYEGVLNGHKVQAWRRRYYIEVFVYGGESAEPGDLIGEWEMPKALGVELAAQQAELQTR